MVYEFGFENFRSYKRRANIDFTAKPITEFEESLIKTDEGVFLLPVCVIYGPNGGGKSSVLMAFNMLREIVVEPLLQMEFMKKKNEELASAAIEELQEGIKIERQEDIYYKWDDQGKDNPTSFSVLFKTGDNKYRYELSVYRGSILEENLYLEEVGKKTKAVFERDAGSVYLCEELEGTDVEKMNEGLPLVSYISMFRNIEVIDSAIQFFMNMRTLNFDAPRLDRKIFAKMIELDKKRILDIVRSMGIDICDIRIEYDGGKIVEVYTKRKLENGETKELKFSEESSGTRKLFSVLPSILNGIDNGRLFVIDELDAKLHPVLLRRIIELFTNPKINALGAQLLFTSHDMTTMSNEVFRRDEIWFSAINGYDESVLYSMVDFKKESGDKPRKDENYNKQYMEGRYGADPYLHRIQKWEVI